MTAAQKRFSSKLRLEILIAQTLRLYGGSGVEGYPDEQYIAEQVKEWSNSLERLTFAIQCFEDLRSMPWQTPKIAPPAKDRAIGLEEQPPKRKRVAKAKQEASQQRNVKPGFLVCGIILPNIKREDD